MKEIFRAIDDAYSILDKCIDKLLKGRITKDEKLEQEAYCDMEYAVNGTMQNLSYLEGRLKDKTLSEWIKVEDRLPENATLVLVAWRNPDIVGMGYCYGKDNWRSEDGEYSEMATPHYWMPIVPPKED